MAALCGKEQSAVSLCQKILATALPTKLPVKDSAFFFFFF